MQTFERGDVIKVPFPYTDRATRQSRPAVVVSTDQLQDLHGLLWVVMITSAKNRGWPDDVPVANLKRAGLRCFPPRRVGQRTDRGYTSTRCSGRHPAARNAAS